MITHAEKYSIFQALTTPLNTAMIIFNMGTANGSRAQRLRDGVKSSAGWLIPGIGVKRWFLFILLGTTLIGVGLGVLILEIYRTAPESWWLPILSWASLRFLPRPLRAFIFAGLGGGLIFFGILELNRALMSPFLRPGRRVVRLAAPASPARTWPAHCGNRRRTRACHFITRPETIYL